MADSSAQMETYLNWLRDRGQKWPVFAAHRAEPTVSTAIPAGDLPAGDLSDEAVTTEPGSATPSYRVAFVCVTEADAERELMRKMIGAMSLHAEDFAIVESAAALASVRAELIVCLGGVCAPAGVAVNLRGEWQPLTTAAGTVDLLITHHPRDLLQAPTLKRDAWTHLQAVMQRLRNA